MSRRKRRDPSRELRLSCGGCDAPPTDSRWVCPFRVGRDGRPHKVEKLYNAWLRAEVDAGRITCEQLTEEIGSLKVRCDCGRLPHQARPLEAASMWALSEEIMAEAGLRDSR